MTNDYPSIEIDWKPALNKDGSQATSKDGTGIVTSDPLLLTPQLQGQYGGWTFKDTATEEDVKGFWGLPQRPTTAQLEVGVPVLVTLSLGGYKQTGDRYQNISDIRPAPGTQAQPATQSVQEAVSGLSPQPVPVTPVGVDRDTSIREQAFFNNLTPAMLDLLPPEQQAAFIRAYFDTGMLMMRPSVRERAIEILEQEKDVKEIQASPPVTQINEDEEIIKMPW